MALALGLAMIVAALFMATGTSNQDQAKRPEDAVAFETALHRTPVPTATSTPTATATPSPTPTITPAATVTRVAGWLKLHNAEVEIWLPYNYSGGGLDTTIELYAYDAQTDPDRVFTSILVVRMARRIDASGVQEVFAHLNPGFDVVQSPHPAFLKRYEAWTETVEGYAFGDIRIRRVLYLIPHGPDSWLVIFASPIDRFDKEQATFERAIESFSILH
ncbi:MAG: hypothetical protein ACM3JD_09395 [Rudaea sp.]